MSEFILKADNLNVSFSGKPVIRNLSFVLRRGERIIVSGPNGCGKTTLLRCILGNIAPDSGRIDTFTDNIAYCKQGFPNTAFPLSSEEVVRMGLYKNRTGNKTDVEEAMRATGTLHLADRAFFSLSGGERQRVSLARCICQKADLLLLDEPSSFLDSAALSSFTDLMKNLPSGISAVLVTHDQVLIRSLGWENVSLNGGEA